MCHLLTKEQGKDKSQAIQNPRQRLDQCLDAVEKHQIKKCMAWLIVEWSSLPDQGSSRTEVQRPEPPFKPTTNGHMLDFFPVAMVSLYLCDGNNEY